MPINQREKPVIKGEDAKRFLENEKEVNERIEKVVDQIEKGSRSNLGWRKGSLWFIESDNIKSKIKNLKIYKINGNNYYLVDDIKDILE